MILPYWNVGVDIQPGHFKAVAVQKKRHCWQLRGWWYEPFDYHIIDQTGLCHPKHLLDKLQQWRKKLPNRLSVRTHFPLYLVLQQHRKLPTQILTNTELTIYLCTLLKQLYFQQENELVYDYRYISSTEVTLTVAKKAEFQKWFDTIKAAKLTLEAIDLAPCLLYQLAHQQQMASATFVHCCGHDAFILIVSNEGYRTYPLSDFQTQQALIAEVHQYSPRLDDSENEPILLSGTFPFHTPLLPPLHYLHPFYHLQQGTPALPQQPQSYSIAMALATRELEHAS